MAKKVQVPVVGGVRKVIQVGSGSSNASGNPTTISEFAGQVVSLAQLKAALGIVTKPNTQGGGSSAGALVVGPGMSGGGLLVGAVPLNLIAPIPWGDSDGGGDEGAPGPPGQQGRDGATGSAGAPGPAIYLTAEDGEDGHDGIPGPPGPAGPSGGVGPAGPPYYVQPEDGEDGAPGPPGNPGSAGAPGAVGSPGPAIFMLADDGEDGQIGAPGPAGAAGSGVATNLTFDTHPLSPNAANDEFEGAALSAQWAVRKNTAAVVNFSAYAPGAIWVKHSGNSGFVISEPFAPGSSDFSVTLKGNATIQANYDTLTLELSDSPQDLINVPGTSNGLSVSFTAGPEIQTNGWSGGARTQTTAPKATLAGATQMYLHIQRVGGAWTFGYSYDGTVFLPAPTTGVTIPPFTVGYIVLVAERYGATTPTSYFSFDFVRVNQLFL